jgi:putative transposase
MSKASSGMPVFLGALFRGCMAEKDIVEIHDCTNKAWVLDSDRYKRQIETKTEIQSQRNRLGADRKSVKYQKGQNLWH